MLSSTDNNFIIRLFDFESIWDFVLNLGFLFLTHTVYYT